jgi:agmatine deiminase
MVWPTAHAQWKNLPSVEQSYADVANSIAIFEPVTLVVSPGQADTVQNRYFKTQTRHEVNLLEMPIDDSWMRDTGPSFLKHETTGEIAGTDWRFNCWGGYMPSYQEDAQIANRVLGHLDMQAYHSSLVMEGGALHVDGAGTLVTTESVVLNDNRNFGIDKKQAEIELCSATGANRIIWLPGDPNFETGDMTDGHIDGIMCFVKPGVVMFERDISAEGAFAALEKENRRALELATDAHGRTLEIIDLEVDHSCIGQGQELFCSSYINYYLPNGGVVMPVYGVDADLQVQEMLGKVYPDRQIETVNINAIAPGGGGIHCITQQQPA